MTPPMGLSPVDLSLLAVLAVSAAVGLWRGFVFEAASLLGWVVAYIAARRGGPWLVAQSTLNGWVPEGWGPTVVAGACFVLVFVATLVLWAMGARLLRTVVHATPLAVPDRLVGAVFGLLRGVVLLVAAATLVSWTPLKDHEAWQASKGREWLERVVEGLRPFWPDEAARLRPAGS